MAAAAACPTNTAAAAAAAATARFVSRRQQLLRGRRGPRTFFSGFNVPPTTTTATLRVAAAPSSFACAAPNLRRALRASRASTFAPTSAPLDVSCRATSAPDDGGDKKDQADTPVSSGGSEVRVATHEPEETDNNNGGPDTVPYVSHDEEEQQEEDPNDAPADTAAIVSEEEELELELELEEKERKKKKGEGITPPTPEPYMGDVEPAEGEAAPTFLSPQSNTPKRSCPPKKMRVNYEYPDLDLLPVRLELSFRPMKQTNTTLCLIFAKKKKKNFKPKKKNLSVVAG